MTEIKIKKLNCTICGNLLSGENNSRIFFCRPCRLAYGTSTEDSVSPQKFYFAKPLLIREFPKIYFPFQIFGMKYTIMHQDGEDISGEQKIYIPLIFIKNINYFGDIGYYYFLKKVSPMEGSDEGFKIFPADRNRIDLTPYPEIYLLRRETEKDGLGSVSVKTDLKKEGIVMIPFYRYKSEYYDSYLFWKYPSGAVI